MKVKSIGSLPEGLGARHTPSTSSQCTVRCLQEVCFCTHLSPQDTGAELLGNTSRRRIRHPMDFFPPVSTLSLPLLFGHKSVMKKTPHFSANRLFGAQCLHDLNPGVFGHLTIKKSHTDECQCYSALTHKLLTRPVAINDRSINRMIN